MNYSELSETLLNVTSMAFEKDNLDSITTFESDLEITDPDDLVFVVFSVFEESGFPELVDDSFEDEIKDFKDLNDMILFAANNLGIDTLKID